MISEMKPVVGGGNKKIRLLFIFSAVLAALLLYFLVHKKEKIIPIELNCEKLIPQDASAIIRFDDLGSVWSKLEDTNSYAYLKSFSQWIKRVMPVEELGYTNDIRDIRESIGIEPSEENILAFLGKKIMLSLWLENPDDMKFMLISMPDTGSPLFNKIKKLVAEKTGFEEYKGITISVFGEGRYWCLVSDKFILSNDLGTIRKAIDFSADSAGGSVADDIEFKKNIILANSADYVYIKPQRINLKDYDLTKSEIKTAIFSVKFENGIKLISYIFQDQPTAPVKPQKIKSLSFIPEFSSLCMAGNLANIYQKENSVLKNLVVGSDSGLVLLPDKKENDIVIFCEVKNKKIFLDEFEKMMPAENGSFTYRIPFLGLKQFKYFFAGNYFIICSPSSVSEKIGYIINNRKNLLANTDDFRRLAIPKKSNEFFYIDLYKIYSAMTGKNYLKFLEPAGGYLISTEYGSRTVFYFPMTDLPRSELSDIFSRIRRTVYGKIIIEKENLTRKNLLDLREGLSIYNSKTGRYPNRLGSLIDEYLDEIPQELLTRTNRVSNVLNGSGGWFYESGKIQLNVFGTDTGGSYYTQW